ncbi:hypothetical protein [Plasmodium yoelii yoelii]|uniref:Uncharacterized protein n=1 Tax=Plasmodium yoelii yoelii TaxID=73239 RepID=Q7RJK0_PLAYO|nr:hypothetical protein [Plasmodium yoelii yoelii]
MVYVIKEKMEIYTNHILLSKWIK